MTDTLKAINDAVEEALSELYPEHTIAVEHLSFETPLTDYDKIHITIKLVPKRTIKL